VKLEDIDQAIPPQAILTLSPAVFADVENKPQANTVVGLRLLSADEKRRALKLAEERVTEIRGQRELTADEEHEIRIDAQMRYCVAAGMCDPNDITKGSPLFNMVELAVFAKLSDSGARYIFDALLKIEVEKSVAFTEAGPDEVIELVDRIGDGQLTRITGEGAASVLRHLAFALDILRESDDASSVLTDGGPVALSRAG
jgi:hypothetical protein